jgi:uncharacterized membrane protein
MGRITSYFLKGLLFLVPVVATIYVVYIVFTKVDGIFEFPVPGLGFLVTILLITLIGFITSNVLTRGVVHLVDKAFSRLPLVKMIYTSVKDLIDAFVGDKKGFKRPVSVSLVPGSDVSVLGFITSDGLEKIGLGGKVAVYLPQSYNFAGNLIIVPREQVTPLEADTGDLMAFIVSGGISK